MANQACEELLDSLKRLATDDEYADLIISGRNKTYNVHKAVVCTRSPYLAAESRKASQASESHGKHTKLDLGEDDPQALEMAIQYFYFLDYPQPGRDGKPEVNGHGLTNGDHTAEDDRSRAAVNGDDDHDDHDVRAASVASIPTATDSRTADPLEAVDDFVPIPQPKTKPKKKKRKKQIATVKVEEEEGASELAGEPLPEEPVVASPEEPRVADSESVKGDEVTVADEPAEPAEPPAEASAANSGFLAVHAKVYELSKKYGIEGLRALALSKFEGEAVHQWDTEDFLQAAREVYSSSQGGEPDDRRMKDMITEIVFQHPVILDSPETQTAIRGLGLADDVLMRVRKQVWVS